MKVTCFRGYSLIPNTEPSTLLYCMQFVQLGIGDILCLGGTWNRNSMKTKALFYCNRQYLSQIKEGIISRARRRSAVYSISDLCIKVSASCSSTVKLHKEKYTQDLMSEVKEKNIRFRHGIIEKGIHISFSSLLSHEF